MIVQWLIIAAARTLPMSVRVSYVPRDALLAAAGAPRGAVVMRAPGPDPYVLLSLARDCSADQARKAFREAAMRVHPDVCDAPDAAAQFIAVKAAFDSIIKRVGAKRELVSPDGSSPESTAAQAAAQAAADLNDEEDMELFVRMMQESWIRSAEAKRKRWLAGENWKEREYIKHKRSKGKRRSPSGGCEVPFGDQAGISTYARRPNWRGGGRIKPL